MIGGQIGLPIGGVIQTAGISAAVGTASGTSTVSAVGASTASAIGSASGAASVAGVGRALIPAVGSASGQATVSAVGQSFYAAVGLAYGTSTVTGVSIILPITSTRVINKPVDYVLAGHQVMRRGQMSKAALHHAFNE